MPNALIALPDVYESVTRRVAIHVMEQLAQTMRLPASTRVYLPGNTDSVPMNGGTFKDCWDTGVTYPSESRFVVRFTETINEENALAVTVNKPQQLPFFHDEHRDVRIQPVYRYVTLTVNIDYVAPNITVAQRWLDDMRSQYSMGRAELHQHLEYHYAVPDGVLYLLHHLHETIEASPTPLNQSFNDYFDAHRYLPVKTATTLTGTQPVITVPENQHEVLGWFDFTATPPTPEKDGNDVGTYTVGIAYELHYNRPVQMYCEYPLLLHNNPVGLKFRPQQGHTTFYNYNRRVSTRKGVFDAVRALLEAKRLPYIHYPPYDDWVPPQNARERITFYTGLLVIDTDDPHALLDLSRLGDFAFSPFFLEFFYTVGEKAFNQADGIFEFRLYENNTLITTDAFYLDGVRLRTTMTLDPTRYYHIQLSFKRDWTQLSREALAGLRRYPTVVYWTLKALGVELGHTSHPFVDLLGERYPRPGSYPGWPGEGTILGPPKSSFTPPTGTMKPPKGWEKWSGGQWPWPWLGEAWVGIAWPGSVPDGWLETPWVDFNFPSTYPPGYGYPPNTPIPEGTLLWPGIHPLPELNQTNDPTLPGPPEYPYWGERPGSSYPGYPGYADAPQWGAFPSGVIKDSDMQQAINDTAGRLGKYSDDTGPVYLTVLFGEILTFNR